MALDGVKYGVSCGVNGADASSRRPSVTLVHVDPPAAATRPGGEPGRAIPPVGLLAAAGAVRDRDTLWKREAPRVSLLDRGLERWDEEQTAHHALTAGASAVVMGVGSRGLQGARTSPGAIESLVAIGRRLQASSDGVSGGPVPVRIALVGDRTEDAETVLAEDAADIALRGEVDETLPQLLEAVIGGRTGWIGFRGLSWRDSERRIRHERDAIAPRAHAAPAWDLIDLARYSGETGRQGPAVLRWLRIPAARTATIVTSRACAPGCPTCHQSFGTSTRDRSVREVVAEIRDLVQRRGVQTLLIADHSFDGRTGRAIEIARAIAQFRSAPGRRGLTVTFPSGLRGDGLTDELIEALIAAGVRRFPLRVTTAAPRLQRLLKENVDLAKAARALERIAARGAIGHLRMRLGVPTETTGEAALTMRWARQSAAHTASFRPGRDLDLGPAWSDDQAGELDDFKNLRRRALQSFYSCPRRAARLSTGLPRLLPRVLSRIASRAIRWAPRQLALADR